MLTQHERRAKQEELQLIKARKRFLLRQESYKTNLFKLANLIGFNDLGKFHEDVCNKIIETDKKYIRRIFLLPRGHFKTSLITQANIVRYIINNPNIRILLASSTLDNAKKSMAVIKNVFWANEKFREIFPEFCPQEGTKEFGTQMGFNLPNRTVHNLKESSVECCGVGMTITGRHYDKIVLSDIVTQETVGTPGQIQKTKDWVALLEPILDIPAKNTIDIEGTRYDFDDLHGEWEKHAKDKPRMFFCYKKAALYDGDEGEESLFYERFSVRDLKEIRERQGGYIFASQYMLEPIDEATAPFKRKDIKYIERRRLPRNKSEKFTTIDLAIGEGKTADYTVITTAIFDKLDCEYIVDIRYGKWDTNRIIKEIMGMYKREKPYTIGIETVAFQKMMAQILYEISKYEKFVMPIKEIPRDTTKSKNYRIMSLQHRFQQHRIMFCDDLDHDFIENQILRFDPQRKHNKDDLLDTLADMENIKIIPDIAFNEHEMFPMKKFVDYLMSTDETEEFDDMDENGEYDEYECGIYDNNRM